MKSRGGVRLSVWVGLFCFFALVDAKGASFQRRSPQSEAKTNLSAVFTSNKAYFDEFKRYGYDFEKLGLVPEGQARYAFGFNPACDPEAKRANTLQSLPPNVTIHPYTLQLRGEIEKLFAELPCSTDGSKYVAMAAGSIDGEVLDVWTINEAKTLVNVRDGITGDSPPLLDQLQSLHPLDIIWGAVALFLLSIPISTFRRLRQSRSLIWASVATIAVFGAAVLVIILFYTVTVQAFKPVIYIYPTKTTDVTVRLNVDGKFTFTYPTYDAKIGGWKIQADPDGTLTDRKTWMRYPYLFWEAEWL